MNFLLFLPLIIGSYQAGTLTGYIELAAHRDINTAWFAYTGEFGGWEIIQQPDEMPWYVANGNGVVTQYQLAKNVGLIAHNTQTGKLFSKLRLGQIIYVIYGKWRVEKYQIKSSEVLKAVSPNDPYGDLVDSKGKVLNSYEVYERFYSGDGITLQTCVCKDSIINWGRLFVTGEKKQ